MTAHRLVASMISFSLHFANDASDDTNNTAIYHIFRRVMRSMIRDTSASSSSSMECQAATSTAFHIYYFRCPFVFSPGMMPPGAIIEAFDKATFTLLLLLLMSLSSHRASNNVIRLFGRRQINGNYQSFDAA